MTPAWITPEQWHVLNPPAEIRKLGELPRSPEKLLAAARAIKVKEARRYQPVRLSPEQLLTYCNIALSDILGILDAPIPHVFEGKELTINLIVKHLREGAFPGFTALGRYGEVSDIVITNRAACGLPTIALFENPHGPGHGVTVVPTPPGKKGIYVTGAGAACVEECPIEQAFGSYVKQAVFWGHD